MRHQRWQTKTQGRPCFQYGMCRGIGLVFGMLLLVTWTLRVNTAAAQSSGTTREGRCAALEQGQDMLHAQPRRVMKQTTSTPSGAASQPVPVQPPSNTPSPTPPRPDSTSPPQSGRECFKVLVVIEEVGTAGIRMAEHVVSKGFIDHGYGVVARAEVARAVEQAEPSLARDPGPTAQRLGRQVQADLVVSGRSQFSTREETFKQLNGKTIVIGTAAISAKVILVSTGRVLADEVMTASEPFDTTGQEAVQAAAKELVPELFKGLDQFLSRDLVEYRLVVLNVNQAQARTLQDSLRQMQGIRQLTEQRFSAAEGLELEVQVARQQDVCFQSRLFTQLAGFEVVARERQTIYLRPTTQRPTAMAPAQTATYQPGYRASWAVVVGINVYQNPGHDPLGAAVNDAQAMTVRLRELGFQVTTLLGARATRDNILYYLRECLPPKVQDDDRVILFFAGHGATERARGNTMGYFLPVDARQRAYADSAISKEQFAAISATLRAKHIFYMMDACYSGLLLRPSGTARASRTFDALTTGPDKQRILVAGESDQAAYERPQKDHGYFTQAVLEGLTGKADLNHDGLITATELSEYVHEQVKKEVWNDLGQTQTPRYRQLIPGPGEFVFQLGS